MPAVTWREAFRRLSWLKWPYLAGWVGIQQLNVHTEGNWALYVGIAYFWLGWLSLNWVHDRGYRRKPPDEEGHAPE
jgi:hypothetical protein